jgi:hypothetical protein
MSKTRGKATRRKRTAVRGRGIVSSLINKAVDALPIELHIPGIPGLSKSYQYCGPGTRLKERLARGDKGINKLDEACKEHDIAYSRYKDSENRHKADLELAQKAWQRFKASDSSLGEKASAWLVTTAMKAKSKLGGGRKKKRNVRHRANGRGLYLRPYRKQGGGRKKKRKICKKKKAS